MPDRSPDRGGPTDERGQALQPLTPCPTTANTHVPDPHRHHAALPGPRGLPGLPGNRRRRNVNAGAAPPAGLLPHGAAGGLPWRRDAGQERGHRQRAGLLRPLPLHLRLPVSSRRVSAAAARYARLGPPSWPAPLTAAPPVRSHAPAPLLTAAGCGPGTARLACAGSRAPPSSARPTSPSPFRARAAGPPPLVSERLAVRGGVRTHEPAGTHRAGPACSPRRAAPARCACAPAPSRPLAGSPLVGWLAHGSVGKGRPRPCSTLRPGLPTCPCAADCSWCGRLTDAQAMGQLAAAGFTRWSSGKTPSGQRPCTDRTRSDCTALDQVRRGLPPAAPARHQHAAPSGCRGRRR